MTSTTIDVRLHPERLAELEKLANQATPGPWVLQTPEEGDFDDDMLFVTTQLRLTDSKTEVATICSAHPYEEEPTAFNLEQRANAAFIAAANPAVVLSMIDELRQVRAVVESQEKTIEELRRMLQLLGGDE